MFHPKNMLTLAFPPDMPLELAALLAVCARDAVPWLLGRGEPGEGERRRLRAHRNLATLTMGSPVPDSSGKLWMNDGMTPDETYRVPVGHLW